MTAEFGGITWLIFNAINKFSEPNNVCLLSEIITVLLLGLACVFFILSVIDFIFCFLDYEFSYPKPNKVKNIIKENKEYLDEYSEKEVLDNIIQIISNSYCEMAIDNIKEINERSKYLGKSCKETVWALGFMLISFSVELCI